MRFGTWVLWGLVEGVLIMGGSGVQQDLMEGYVFRVQIAVGVGFLGFRT